MKLLIEIPEEQYRILNAKSQNDIVTAIDDALLIKAIRNGKPLDSVLDEIKTEIEDYESDCNYHLSEEDNCRTCNKITFGSIYRIIDKYKAESEEEK